MFKSVCIWVPSFATERTKMQDYHILFKKRLILLLERREGREKEREINVCGRETFIGCHSTRE